MTTLPLITIVTPSFNQAQFLEETIQSVLRQDYPHIEYIIIDGGSTDGSIDIIKKYEKHIAYWVSESDTGQSNAINKGFAKATGEIFAWLNSDDLLLPSAARLAAYFLSQDTGIGLVYGDRLEIDIKGNVIGLLKCPAHDSSMFKKNFTLPQETAFFRGEIFKKVGGVDEQLHFAMDFDLWCKITAISRMKHLPALLGCFRRHESSKSVQFHDFSNDVSYRFMQEHERVFKRHFGSRPPSGPRMNIYRLYRKAKLMLDTFSKSRNELSKMIRHLMSSNAFCE
jgi:glycosyltransferase involved in cell wall biosynthesis